MAAALLVAACQPVAHDRADPGTTETATVTWIYDGDTIEVEQSGTVKDIRLVGINAPDSGECFYTEALEFLISELKGERVELNIVGRDQFDRTLAYVWAEEILLNLDLVERGLAIATTPDADETYGSSLLEAEERAMTDQAGLWAETVCGAGGVVPALTIEVDARGEVVTVTNSGTEEVVIGGWIIRDESSRHRYRFPEGASISPGEDLRIASTETGWQPGDTNVWNNDGDMAMIMDHNGRVIAARRYP